MDLHIRDLSLFVFSTVGVENAKPDGPIALVLYALENRKLNVLAKGEANPSTKDKVKENFRLITNPDY